MNKVLTLLFCLFTLSLQAQFRPVSGSSSGGGFEDESTSYFSRVGITNVYAKERINGYVEAMKRFGLYSTLTDAVLGSSYLNPTTGSNMATLKGVYTTLSTNQINLNKHGFSVQSGIGFTTLGIPDTRTFTLTATIRNISGYQTDGGTWMALDSATGSNVATHFQGQYSPTPYNGVMTVSNNAIARGCVQFGVTPGTQGAVVTDAIDHHIALTCNGAGVMKTYVDGYLIQTSGATNALMDSALTRLTLGNYMSGATAWPAALWRGEINHVAVWNSVLSDSQVSNAFHCARWLRWPTKNFVIEGDSTSQHNINTPTESWPYHYFLTYPGSNNVAIFSVAAGGDTAANMRLTYTNQIRPLRPKNFGVDESILVLSPGINDIIAGTSGATTWTYIDEMIRAAALDGFEVWMSTLPQSLYYSAAQQTQRTLLNELILTNQHNVAKIIRRDMLYSSTNAVDFNADGLHYSTIGYRKMAQLVAGQGEVRPQGPFLLGSASLNFGSTGLGAIAGLTITVAGAQLGDKVLLTVPAAASSVAGSYYAVASNDVVHVIFVPTSAAQDPAAGTFEVQVTRQ